MCQYIFQLFFFLFLFRNRRKDNSRNKLVETESTPSIQPDLPSYVSLKRYDSAGGSTYDDLSYVQPKVDETTDNLRPPAIAQSHIRNKTSSKDMLSAAQSLTYENIEKSHNNSATDYVNDATDYGNDKVGVKGTEKSHGEKETTQVNTNSEERPDNKETDYTEDTYDECSFGADDTQQADYLEPVSQL